MTPLRKLALFYFFSYGAAGALLPMLPLLLAARDLDATEISWVMALNPALAIFVPPLWGLVADAFQIRLTLLRVVAFGSALTCLLFLPHTGVLFAMIAMSVFCFFRTPTASLMDAATYAALGPTRKGFARTRLWGSVGFGACVGVAGIIDVAERQELLLALVAIFYLIAGIVSLTFTGSPVTRERAVFSRAVAYISSSGLTLLFITNAIYYCAQSTFDIYYSLHLEHLKLPSDVIGYGWAVAVFAEVGIMAIAPQIIATRKSWNILLFCCVVSTVRWLLNSVVTDQLALILIQAMHGFTFGLWYLALVNHVQEQVPEDLRTSVQGAMLASMSIGTIAGALGGGPILEHFGGDALFQSAASLSFAAFLIYLYLSKRPLNSGAA